MIDEKFKEVVESDVGCAVVMAGSDSDKPHIENIIESLKKYKIPHSVRICSAHKQLEGLYELIDEYNDIKGALAIIAVAGGTDALSGAASFNSLHPVLSCPPDAPNESCTRNPPGSSNSYVPRYKNVARFVAQMYAHKNPKYREILLTENKKKVGSLKKADAAFQAEYTWFPES